MKVFKIVLIFLLLSLPFFIFTPPVHAASLVWTGAGSDNNWSTCANWGGTCPTASDTVTFNGTSTKNSYVDSSFGGTISVLNINSGYTGTITLQEPLTTSSTFTQAAGNFNGANQNLIVTSTFTLSGGVFTAPSTTMTVSGNFAHSSGTFTANGGTVSFVIPFTSNSGNQTISGSTTFNNLTDNGSIYLNYTNAPTLTFTAGTTQTITGTLTLHGIQLFSSAINTPWNIDPQGTRDIQNVNVQDSYNINASPITISSASIDMGGNTGWTFTGSYGPTNVKDLSNPNNFNIRIDGAVSEGHLGEASEFFADLTGDGKDDDLIVLATSTSYSHPYGASVYIINHDILNQHIGIGQTLDLANSSNYSIRIDGVANSASGRLYGLGNMGGVIAYDLTGSGSDDLILPEAGAGFNGRSFSGSLFIIYNSLLKTLERNLTGDKSISLDTTSNYNLRIDGVASTTFTINGGSVSYQSRFTEPDTIVGNIFNDGGDLIANAQRTHGDGSKPAAGSVYIFSNSLISHLQGTGNTLDLTQPSSYTLRIDGPYPYSQLGGVQDNGNIVSADIRNEGSDSLIFSIINSDPNRCSYDSGTNAYTCNFNLTIHQALYFISDEILNRFSKATTGQTLDLADSNSYNLEVQDPVRPGTDYSSNFAYALPNTIADFYNTGHLDFVTGAWALDNNNRPESGSAFIFPYSKYNQYLSTTGNLIQADSSSYSLKIDGGYTGDWFTNDAINYTDFYHLGLNDLLVGSPHGKLGAGRGQNPGTIYIIKNSIINNLSGFGNTLDLASPSNSSLVYVGTWDSHLIMQFPTSISSDVIFAGAHQESENGRHWSGSVYLIYDFPHTISASGPTGTETPDSPYISGTVNAVNSVTAVAGVQYSLDNNSPTATSWTSCSGTTSFVCTPTNLSIGDHTIYVRAYDTNGVYTAKSQYTSFNFTVIQGSAGAGTPDPNCKQGWKYCINAGPNYSKVISNIQTFVNSSYASSIIPNTSNHDDMYVTVKDLSLNDLNSQGIPYPWSQGLNVYSDFFQFTALSAFNGYPILTTDHPFTIQLPFDKTKLNSLSPTKLKVAYFDSVTKKWKTLKSPVVIDWTHNILSATTTTFSIYVLVYPSSVTNQTTQNITISSPAPTLQASPTGSQAGGLVEPKNKFCILWWCW